MIVGVLKEIKQEENRVSLTPTGVEVLRQGGHTVLVEKGAGDGSGFVDAAYAEPQTSGRPLWIAAVDELHRSKGSDLEKRKLATDSDSLTDEALVRLYSS